MDLNKINSYLAFYFQWSNAKSDPEKFAELDKQLEEITRDFFSELTGNEIFFSWMHANYYFKNKNEYMSIMAEVGSSMVKSAENGSMLFNLSDLHDIHGLVTELTNNQTTREKYIKAKLPHDIDKWGDKNEFQKVNSNPIKEKLVDCLNDILKDNSFYDEEVFQEVGITEETRMQFATEPKGKNLMRLNRVLLETLFPLYIKWHPKPKSFGSLKQFESWIFKSMKGKANKRMKVGESTTDILIDRIKTAEEKKKKKAVQDEDTVKEFDNRVDVVINDEIEIFEVEEGETHEGIADYDEKEIFEIGQRGSDEDFADYDEDGNEMSRGFTSIENIGDPSEAGKQELNTLRTDISLFNDTVAFLLTLIYKDLSEEDMVLEKKIAWQIGTNYEGLLYEKVGLFADPILIAHDIATVVRYEHWQTVKEL